mmetsp:Transcript_20768/g.30745  ORF Transcript_20768/g.30745 Transcript_20768/m.30745 type:complete len:556 (+) Transcript_20768:132-1799(+)
MIFSKLVSALAASAATLALVDGIDTNPDNSVAVHTSNDLNVEYEWEYVAATSRDDAHVKFDIILSDVEVFANTNAIYGVALGVISSAITEPGNQYTFMQAERALLFTIDYNGNTPRVEDFRLMFGWCEESTQECNQQGGWGRPLNRVRDKIERSLESCGPTPSRAEVLSITSSKSGSKQNLKIRVKMYKEAMQTCSEEFGHHDPLGRFAINFEGGATTQFTWSVWASDSLASVNDDPFYDGNHLYWWQRSDVKDVQLTIGTPTKAPTNFPSKSPTKSPTLKPTKSPTTARPTRSPTTGVPSKAPTHFPTKAPSDSPTAYPTNSPTTGKPSRAPTNFPTKSPTKFPTMRPTKSPTTGSPSRAPTKRPTKPPTFEPTKAPTIPLTCPHELHWIRCSNINTMYQHFRNDPDRRARNVRRECEQGDNGRYCVWCPEGKDSFTGCRPRRNPDGVLFSEGSVCGSNEDPFLAPELKCKPFEKCPPPEVMSGCRSINALPGKSWRKKGLCEEPFEFQGFQIERDACVWCNGVCRAASPYERVTNVICKTPGLFDQLRNCPLL